MSFRPRFVAMSVAFLWCLVSPATSPAEVLVRISAEETVHQVNEIDNEIWYGTDNGAYRAEGNTPKPILKGVTTYTISKVNGEIWLGTDKGIYRIEEGSSPTLILEDEIGPKPVTSIYFQDQENVTWLGTPRGLFRAEGSEVTPLLSREAILAIREIDGHIWVGTGRNAFRLSDLTNPTSLFSEDSARTTSDIVKAGGAVWLITNRELGRYGPCFRVIQEQPPRAIEVPSHEVISVADVQGDAWFSTTRGVFLLEGGKLKLIQRFSEPVNTIAAFKKNALGKEETWAGTTQRPYRLTGNRFSPTPEAYRLNIKGFIRDSSNQTWMWGETGAYRLDGEVEIVVDSTVRDFFGQDARMHVHIGSVIKIEEARYDLKGKDPYDGSISDNFAVVLEADREKYKNEIAEGNFIPAKSLERTVGAGIRDLYIMVRDSCGNTKEILLESVLILPGWTSAGFLIALTLSAFWWSVGIVVLLLSPRFKPAMSFIMDFRTVGSLWIIPLALLFPFVRAHLLLRYLREVIDSDDFLVSPKGDDLSATPQYVLGELSRRRRLLLTGGRRETARKFLRHLARQLALDNARKSVFKRVVPIFLRLDLHAEGQSTIEEGALGKLARYGGISDKTLAKKFLEQSEYIFLLDGFGQLKSEDRAEVELFVENRRGVVVMTCDDDRVSLEGFHKIPLALRTRVAQIAPGPPPPPRWKSMWGRITGKKKRD